MEFSFAVNDIIKQEIVKVDNTLLPEGFVGDRKTVWSCQEKISTIIDIMGKASAAAQGLNLAITTGDRLKNSDHIVHLLIDKNGKDGKGTIVGLLKTGRKKLFVFDEAGAHHEIIPLCVLDFYVHESKQRMGCGKKLFDFMLQDENLLAGQLAIDRPSEKFIAFLYKHYGLKNIIPQMNNFVVFDEFFKYISDSPSHIRNTNHSSEAKHVFTPKSGITNSSSSSNSVESGPKQRVPEQYGWKAPLLAQRPTSSIGQILQHSANMMEQSPSSISSTGLPGPQATKQDNGDKMTIPTYENVSNSSREHTPKFTRSADYKNLIPQNNITVQENGTQSTSAVKENNHLQETSVSSPSKTQNKTSEQDLENIQTNLTNVLCVQEFSDQDPNAIVKRDLKFHHEPLW